MQAGQAGQAAASPPAVKKAGKSKGKGKGKGKGKTAKPPIPQRAPVDPNVNFDTGGECPVCLEEFREPQRLPW